ncbi:2-polyprenyl-6-methoxyphenol hydroxylase [Amycolatopsis sacchari]|uniref:2-polyprenyl-6-methoxyphenol hydroxylase n=1 Tax=Amycolatopsis sacchari TaxID=115433 RepID=A0A1I3WSD2_9PSEU|nr:FAD-dependent monooxygenase [Amycolatopsis sacchari]SFK09361.1 2-polyprenyl-6-methoxyphenol hydroxylase [Amycolatopsis sacchari]
MTAVGPVGIVGAGMAGLGAAILLAEAGVPVDVIETAGEVGALGSGVTLQGNALRVLRRLGVWEGVSRAGYAFNSAGLRAPDGTLLAEVPDSRTGGPDLPATVGIYRPDLARLLVDRATGLGVKIRTGVRPVLLTQDDHGVDLACSDGTRTRYDLVVGADGVRSWTRDALGVRLRTEAVGMGIWRAFAKRPSSVTRTDLCYGGAAYIAGYCPTGEDTLYAYLVEDAQDRSGLSAEERLATMRGLAEHYHGLWDDIRANLTDPSRVHYTWFEWHFLDGPWHRGRTVLIGDAAHCCPPTMAQGAAQALEDALVLAELLTTRETLDEDLWSAFTARRLDRARTVVEGSVQMCRWLLAGEQGDLPGLLGRVRSLLVEEP